MPKILANGVELYYELHGPEDSPLLVLNNGIIMNATSSWVFQTKALSSQYRLLQYDCRGQGKSDHPDSPYSMDIHAEDLAALLTALGYEQAHIAGISYGGEVAQAFAFAYPERCLSLILIDTVSEIGDELRMTVEAWRQVAAIEDADAFFNTTVPWNFSPEFISSNTETLTKAKERYHMLDFPAVVRLCDSFFEVDFTERLNKISCPTCIIVGSADILKKFEYSEILMKGIPHAEFHILYGAGHASCWERPEEFNSIVLGFLAKQQN